MLTASIVARLALVLPTQNTTPACNNTSRDPRIEAGYHNSLDETCQTITFSVAGASISTPTMCNKGYAYYAGTVFVCSGALANYNCNPLGFKVPIKLAQGGGCPDVSALGNFIGAVFTSWGDVPSALAAAMRCRAPQITPTYDWSAALTPCDSKAVTLLPAGGFDATGDPYQIVTGDPRASLPYVAWDFLPTPFDLAKRPGSPDLDPHLAALEASHLPMAGASLSARIEKTWMQGANVVGTDRALIEGRISDRGRFDLTATRLAEAAGEVSPLRERTLFDGSCFVWDCPESELGLALGPSYPRLSETAELLAGDNRPLFGWIVDPFFLPLFDGVTVQASPPNAQGQVILERAVQVGSMGAFLERWTVDASSQQAHPTHLEWIDSLGRRIFEVDY